MWDIRSVAASSVEQEVDLGPKGRLIQRPVGPAQRSLFGVGNRRRVEREEESCG